MGLGHRTPNPLSVVNLVRADKFARFSTYMQSVGDGYRLVTIPLSTLGGWHPDVYSVVLSLASAIASKAVVPFTIARNILF